MKVTKGKGKLIYLLILVLVLSMIPISSLAGDHDLEKIEPIENDTVTAGIKVDLFNYGNGINKNAKNNNFGFFDNAGRSVDSTIGQTYGNGATSIAENILGEDGFPILKTNSSNKVSMSYLFEKASTQDAETNYDDRYSNQGNYTKKHFSVNEANNGLFQKDEDGYYYYSSQNNSAYYNPETQAFELYEHLLKPGYTSNTDSNIAQSNFLPFNKASSYSASNNITTNYGDKKVYKALRKDLDSLSIDEIDTTERATYVSDLWFGMTTTFEFLQPVSGKVNEKNMVFEFEGDDDVLVFIDGVKILDIGGTHASQKGTIDFATGKINNRYSGGSYSGISFETTLKDLFMAAKGSAYVDENFDGNTFNDYSKHSFKFYYLERGGNISFCSLKFNLPVIENPLPLTVKKEVTGGTDASSNDEFKFQLKEAKTNDVTSAANKTFIKTLTNKETVTDTTDANGVFYLKAGEKADFSTLLGYEEEYYYQVQELDIDISDYPVTEVVNNKNMLNKTTTSRSGTDTSVGTAVTQAMTRSEVVFTNTYDPQDFNFTKTVIDTDTNDGLNPPSDAKFDFKVFINNSSAYTGSYKVNGITKKGNDDGIITIGAGDKVTIENLLLGDSVKVVEYDMPRYFQAADDEQSLIMTLGGGNSLEFTNYYKRGNLEVTKSNDPGRSDGYVKAGDIITYTIKAENNGKGDLTGVWIKDFIPEHTEYVDGSVSNDGIYNTTDESIEWFIETLEPGADNTKTFTFRVQVLDTYPKDDLEFEIENTAYYENTETTEPAIGGNDVPEKETDTVYNPTMVESYTAVKSNSPDEDTKVGPDDTITYTIKVKNTGNVTISGLKIMDTVPEYTEYVSGDGSEPDSDNTIYWNLDLNPGQEKEVTFTVKVQENYPNGHVITNIAYTGTGEEPGDPTDPVNNPTLSRGYTAQKFTDTDPETPVIKGDEITYRIVLENIGEIDYDSIVIRDSVPEYTSFVSSDGIYDKDNNCVDWKISLEAGMSKEVTFTVKVLDYPAGHIIRNIAFTGIEEPDNETNEVENPTAYVLPDTANPNPSGDNQGNVLGQKADPFQQKVLGEEARTGDLINLMPLLVILLLMALAAVTVSLYRVFRTEK